MLVEISPKISAFGFSVHTLCFLCAIFSCKPLFRQTEAAPFGGSLFHTRMDLRLEQLEFIPLAACMVDEIVENFRVVAGNSVQKINGSVVQGTVDFR